MSVPPDQFDEDGNPIEPEDDSFEEDYETDYVPWQGVGSSPPNWFSENVDFFGELQDRDSVFLEVFGGLGSVEKFEDGTYEVTLRGYDEDTGEEFFWEMRGYDHDQLMDFYDYINEAYGDVSFWGEGGSGDLGGL